MRILLSLLFCLIITACDEAEQKPPPQEEQKPSLTLTPSTFSQLPSWGSDDFSGLVRAFDRSCFVVMKKLSEKQFGALKQSGTYGDWKNICLKFTTGNDWDQNTLEQFFEQNFTPYQISDGNNPIGLFTGYYEASLKGSHIKTERYNIPLHIRPDDLVMVHLGQFREELKGIRIAGRVVNGNLKPYEDRAEIISGNWPHNDKILLWVDSAVDAFFVQIQGSGIVEMENGKIIRIGYAGQNGHPYYAIGRELIKIGALTKENISMQSIRKWLEDNPEKADEIMNTNKSYVFFREIKGDGPIGAQGMALTPERSLAIDRTLISYGLPLWVDIESPEEGQENMRKIMIAQDTGGAINGAVRGDFFWGHGDKAEAMAGKMNSQGRYWVLLPKKD